MYDGIIIIPLPYTGYIPNEDLDKYNIIVNIFDVSCIAVNSTLLLASILQRMQKIEKA